MFAPIVFVFLGVVTAAPPAENLLVNGDFEQGLSGWNELWTRDSGGKLLVERRERHSGTAAARIEHTGQRDWSLSQKELLKVEPGQIYELSGWVRLKGMGSTTLCVTLFDADHKPIDWAYGGQTSAATDEWRMLRSRFIVPRGVATLQPRLIGYGPATVLFDDARLVLQGNVGGQNKDLPARLAVAGKFLEVEFHTDDGTLAVKDRRTGRRWKQWARTPVIILNAKTVADGLDLTLIDPASMLRLTAAFRLDPRQPEIAVSLSAEGEMSHGLAYPQPFSTDKDTLLILPLNEGISYPAGDASIEPAYHYFYGGHGLCMAWYGQTDGRQGVMAIAETADDGGVSMTRHAELLTLAPEWEPQKAEFGYARRMRWVFFDDGGYVALCKRYRRHAKETGLLKTLAEKRAANPNVDLLVGAVNTWYWERDAVAICREMRAAGIDRILWSNRAEPETLRRLNAMDVLTSRYDIYQDVMDPANFPKLRWIHSDWPTAAWPKDLTLDASGQWVRGWEVEAKSGPRIPCGVLCDRQAPEYARRRIPAELKTHPYRCRFIDTTTAAPWRECYDKSHPMTRSESRRWKMELLGVVSDECGLVTGSETGHDAAVPYAHYFEGMMSLGPYRVADAGRNMSHIVEEVPPAIAKFQTGHYYRLPLWELVYHDCLVAQWYWGDYNNKLPKVWDRRDLINALYGTPPMFMFDRRLWTAQRERFVQSYRTATPVARATGYSEMLSHRWLTGDHSVQETQFANGVKVTANFGGRPYSPPDGKSLPALGHRVEGLPNAR